MAKNITLTQDELQALIAGAVAQALAQTESAKQVPSSAKQKKTTNGKGLCKLVEFTKANGQTVQCTEAQAKAWEAYRSRSHKSLDEVKAEFTKAREAYKPSQALVKAIKADRAAITRKVAKEQYGFVGTKEDLKALKDEICK